MRRAVAQIIEAAYVRAREHSKLLCVRSSSSAIRKLQAEPLQDLSGCLLSAPPPPPTPSQRLNSPTPHPLPSQVLRGELIQEKMAQQNSPSPSLESISNFGDSFLKCCDWDELGDSVSQGWPVHQRPPATQNSPQCVTSCGVEVSPGALHPSEIRIEPLLCAALLRCLSLSLSLH